MTEESFLRGLVLVVGKPLSNPDCNKENQTCDCHSLRDMIIKDMASDKNKFGNFTYLKVDSDEQARDSLNHFEIDRVLYVDLKPSSTMEGVLKGRKVVVISDQPSENGYIFLPRNSSVEVLYEELTKELIR